MASRAPVDTDLAAMLAEAPAEFTSAPDASVDDLRASAHTNVVWMRGPVDSRLAAVPVVEDTIDGVPVRWYGPPLDADTDVVVFLHGGGWTAGDLDSYDPDVRLLAARLGTAVVAVDYRRAPEHPFPAALDDCVDVIRAVADLPHRALAVAGDSAGGNLALGSALALASEGIIAAVLALYPVVDVDAIGNDSYRANGSGYILTTEAMVANWGRYTTIAESRRDPRANLAVASLEGFPPTVIVSAGYDPLHDEARDFAVRLVEAGVDVTYLPHPTLTHGFQQMVPRIPAATRAMESIIRAFSTALARSVTASHSSTASLA